MSEPRQHGRRRFRRDPTAGPEGRPPGPNRLGTETRDFFLQSHQAVDALGLLAHAVRNLIGSGYGAFIANRQVRVAGPDEKVALPFHGLRTFFPDALDGFPAEIAHLARKHILIEG